MDCGSVQGQRCAESLRIVISSPRKQTEKNIYTGSKVSIVDVLNSMCIYSISFEYGCIQDCKARTFYKNPVNNVGFDSLTFGPFSRESYLKQPIAY